jgi:lactonase
MEFQQNQNPEKKEGQQMKRLVGISALLFGVLILVLIPGYAGTLEVSKSMVPIPPDLVALPTIKAEPWLQIDTNPSVTLEGPSFDRQGNLFVTSIRNPGRVFKITPQKQVSVIFENKDIEVDGTAFHKDGRLFIVCLSGELLAMNPDGTNVTSMKPTYEGRSFRMNDLVFDSKGDLFVSDFVGNVSNPIGGIYYLSSNFSNVKLVLRNLWAPNGVSLSPDGKTLWVSETARNTIIRVDFLPDGVTPIPNTGVTFPYRSTGSPGGPDSNRVDANGNLYQAIMAQGRVLILNNRGIPIANVVVPGRDEGKYLKTTNLAFKPGTREAYITAGGEGGAWIFKFEAIAEGATLFSHR